MLNIAVLAPMPRARVSTEITVNPGVFKSERVPCRTSCHTLSIIDILEPEVHVGIAKKQVDTVGAKQQSADHSQLQA